MRISPKRVSLERGLRRRRKEPVDGTDARDVQVRGSEPRRFFAGQSGAQLRFAKLDGANLDGATLRERARAARAYAPPSLKGPKRCASMAQVRLF
jgi:hypothetical protein